MSQASRQLSEYVFVVRYEEFGTGRSGALMDSVFLHQDAAEAYAARKNGLRLKRRYWVELWYVWDTAPPRLD